MVASSAQTTAWSVRAWLAAAVRALRRSGEQLAVVGRIDQAGGDQLMVHALFQQLLVDKDAVQVVKVAWAGVGERHGPAVLVGEPGQDVALGLVRGGGGDAFAVALDVAEPQQPQELRGGGMGQPQGWCWRKPSATRGL
jgi:hypothetical protein